MEPSDAQPRPDVIAGVLDGIPGAWERAQTGRRQAAEGNTVALDEPLET